MADDISIPELPKIERDPVLVAQQISQLLDTPEVKDAMESVRQMWFMKFKASRTAEERLEAQAGAVALDTLETVFRTIISAGERAIKEREARDNREKAEKEARSPGAE